MPQKVPRGTPRGTLKKTLKGRLLKRKSAFLFLAREISSALGAGFQPFLRSGELFTIVLGAWTCALDLELRT
ncbi:MAG TPA: hypothetical protein PK156_02845 [Polyangium sp.]|nr:hypothetical protein [Polyangium sp.]